MYINLLVYEIETKIRFVCLNDMLINHYCVMISRDRFTLEGARFGSRSLSFINISIYDAHCAYLKAHDKVF